MTGRQIVTGWFRMPNAWALLEQILADLRRPPVVWTGACGTGEEAWTAAILLAEAGRGGRVIATDIDEPNLATAAAGVYPTAEVAAAVAEGDLSRTRARRWLPTVDGGHRIADELRPMVTFSRLDLASDDDFPACDLILLRNVFRHLSRYAQRATIWDAAAVLPADGRLVLGGSDLWRLGVGDIEPFCLSSRFIEAEHDCIWRPR